MEPKVRPSHRHGLIELWTWLEPMAFGLLVASSVLVCRLVIVKDDEFQHADDCRSMRSETSTSAPVSVEQRW